MNSKRKLLISMLAIVFVLLAVVATVAIAFALTQQTITTTLNIGYVVEDIDGTASATYTIGGVTESLTAKKGNQVIGDTLVFHAGDTEDAGNLMFPEGQIPLSAQNDNVVIQYTYSNTGEKHYIASMSFDGNISADNMKVEYSINGVDYSEQRYAVVVPANTSNKSYWIKISIENKAKSASFTGDFKWLLEGCDEQSKEYLTITSLEFQQVKDYEGNPISGSYSASLKGAGEYVSQLVIPREVNGSPVTMVGASNDYNRETDTYSSNINELVTSVYIPDTITEIGEFAFVNFKNLQTVTFEQNEKAGASSQSGGGLKWIEGLTFVGCSKLKEIQIPNTVQGIGYMAFGWTALTKINIPESITSLGENVFDGTNLQRIDITNIEKWAQIDYQNYPSNPMCYTDAELYLNGELVKRIELGNSITSIGNFVFNGCKSLEEVVILDNIKTIDWNAFGGCENLTSVTFANKTGWKAGSTAITEAQLSNPQTAAQLLTDTYSMYPWTRS